MRAFWSRILTGSVFAQQQLEDCVEVLVYLALLAERIAILLAAEQIDDVLEAGIDLCWPLSLSAFSMRAARFGSIWRTWSLIFMRMPWKSLYSAANCC